MSKINLFDGNGENPLSTDKFFENFNILARLQEIERKLAIIEPKTIENEQKSNNALIKSDNALLDAVKAKDDSKIAITDSLDAFNIGVDANNIAVSGFQSSFEKIFKNFESFSQGIKTYRQQLTSWGNSAKSQASNIQTEVNQAVNSINTFANDVNVLAKWKIINLLGVPIIWNMGGWLQQLQKSMLSARNVMNETEDVLTRVKTYINWMGDVQKAQSDTFVPIDTASTDLASSFGNLFNQVEGLPIKDKK